MVVDRMVRVMGLGLGLGAAGCAGVMSAGPEKGTDLRGTVGVKGAEPELLLVGPALLLHVNGEGKSAVSVFRVARRDHTPAGCPSDPAAGGARDDAHGPLELAENESACVVAVRGSRVSWHARLPVGASPPKPAEPLSTLARQ